MTTEFCNFVDQILIFKDQNPPTETEDGGKFSAIHLKEAQRGLFLSFFFFPIFFPQLFNKVEETSLWKTSQHGEERIQVNVALPHPLWVAVGL